MIHGFLQRVICPLTEEEEFAKYSGMEGLLEFYREECGLVVYNRAIPDFKIPTSGDLVNNILDLTYHLSKGRNCLIHCAGGTGRTGMVLAAVIKNLGVYDYIARIRYENSYPIWTYRAKLWIDAMLELNKAGNISLYALLSRIQSLPGRTDKQEQKLTSCNHMKR